MKKNRLTGALLLVLPFILFQCTGNNQQTSTSPPDGISADSMPYVIDTVFAAGVNAYKFDSISWITVHPNTGHIYVLQRAYPPVSVWTPEGELLSEWTTRELGYPHSISLNYQGEETTVWITDFAPPQIAGDGWGHCIKEFTLSGKFLGSVGDCGENSQGTGLEPIQFDKVTDIDFDAEKTLFVSDGDLGGMNNRVLKMDSLGMVEMEWSAPNNQAGAGPKEFNLPHAVVVDELNRVWIADALNSRIQVITTTGDYLGEWRFDATMAPNGLSIGKTEVVNGRPIAEVLTCCRPTDLTGGLEGQVWVIPALMDAEDPSNFGELQPTAHWKEPNQEGSAMLHSCAISPVDGAIYLGFLNQSSPPVKYIKK